MTAELDLQQAAKDHLWLHFTRMSAYHDSDVPVITRGEGAYVYEPTMDQIREMARTLKSERPVPGNSVQLTGGEPTIRPELPEIIRMMHEEGIDHVQLNTNGINLALDPSLAGHSDRELHALHSV